MAGWLNVGTCRYCVRLTDGRLARVKGENLRWAFSHPPSSGDVRDAKTAFDDEIEYPPTNKLVRLCGPQQYMWKNEKMEVWKYIIYIKIQTCKLKIVNLFSKIRFFVIPDFVLLFLVRIKGWYGVFSMCYFTEIYFGLKNIIFWQRGPRMVITIFGPQWSPPIPIPDVSKSLLPGGKEIIKTHFFDFFVF